MPWNRGAIAVGIFAFAASGALAQSGDLANLQGTWWMKTRVASLAKSRAGSKPLYSTAVIEFQGNTMKMTLMTPDGRTHRYDEGIVLNESANPRHLDSTTESPLGKVRSIYEISGDTLKICSAGPGKPRPTQFVGSSDALTFPRLVTYARGLPPEGMPSGGREAREKKVSRFPANFRARATVLEVDKHNNVLLEFEDGKQLRVKSQIGSAYDASGVKLKDAHSVKKVGNVLDVSLTGKVADGEDSYSFNEARLVKGELVVHAAPVRKPVELQTGVVKQITVWRATIDVDGTEVHVNRRNGAAPAYDMNGTLLPRGSADRMLNVGNKVQIAVNPKQARQAYPTLREIHLVEGTLAEPGVK